MKKTILFITLLNGVFTIIIQEQRKVDYIHGVDDTLLPHISKKVFDCKDKIIVFYDKQYSIFGVDLIDSAFQNMVVILNCPMSNTINDIKVDDNSVVWTALSGNGVFMSFNNNIWKAYKFDSAKGRSCEKICPAKNGSIYGSFFGSGLGVLSPAKDNKVSFFNEKNSKFTGYQGNALSWILIGGIKEDKNGIVYALNWAELSGPAMIAFDKELNAYPLYNNINPSYRKFNPLVIDANNIKWLGSSDDGLYAFNDKNTLSDISDDVVTVLNSNITSALTDESISDLAIDKDGYIWIGTPSGPFVLINPSYVMSKNVKPIIRKVKQMTNVPINRIAVDAQNQKWIGTNSGIWILNADASEIIAQITKDNSPLLSNVIKSIEFNNKSGEVYVGTEKGLSIFNSLSIQPSEDYSNLKCYPQPYNPEKDGYLFIEGMAKSARIKILTIGGQEVASIDTESDKAIWDGKDKNGDFAPNGVYLIVSDSKEEGKSGIVKAAILRK